MKSLIASLRSLTLPFGATSGPRIVLNGVQGRIEVYSDLGNLLITIDDDGLIVYDADGEQRQKIGSISDFSSIVFRDEDGLNPALITYQSIQPGDDHRTFAIYAPDVGSSTFSRFFLQTPTDLLTPPLLQWDTGFLDSAGAQPIADLTGFTGDLAARTVVHDLWQGESLGGGNAPNVNTSYPRGIIAKASRTTIVTYDGETTVLTLPSCELEEDRRYRWVASWRSLNWNTAAGTTISLMRIRYAAAGTILAEDHQIVTTASPQAGNTMTMTLDCPSEIPAGTYAFVFTASAPLGAVGTMDMAATATGKIVCTVEDMGSALTGL